MTIDVIPSEFKEDDKRYLHLCEKWPYLPKPPFVMGAVGMIGSGKTSFIYTMINKFYADYFDQVLIYNGTKDSNRSWERVKQRKVEVRNAFHEGEFHAWYQAVMDDQERRVHEGKQRKRYCVLFDDMIADNIMHAHRATRLEQFLLNIRHYNCCCIISTQSYKKFSKAARLNMTHFAVFRTHRKEIEDFAEEEAQHLQPDELVRLYQLIMRRKQFNFLLIDIKADPDERFREGMERVLRVHSSEDDAAAARGAGQKRKRAGAAEAVVPVVELKS